jgi:enoyl-CoA hydratase
MCVVFRILIIPTSKNKVGVFVLKLTFNTFYMPYHFIHQQDEGAVRIWTIQREEKLNALNQQLIQELSDAVTAFQKDDTLRVGVLQSAGEKAFVAGADIKEFASFNTTEGYHMAKKGHDLLFSPLAHSHKPVLALIQGYALGGGLELAMSCTFRIAAETAQFGLPELHLGLIPGYGGTQRLTQLVGASRSLEMMLMGKRIDAQTALQWGLVNQVVTYDLLRETGLQWAQQLATQSPQAIAAATQAVHASLDARMDGFEKEHQLFGECFQTPDFKEGVQAFLEKRKPKF